MKTEILKSDFNNNDTQKWVEVCLCWEPLVTVFFIFLASGCLQGEGTHFYTHNVIEMDYTNPIDRMILRMKIDRWDPWYKIDLRLGGPHHCYEWVWNGGSTALCLLPYHIITQWHSSENHNLNLHHCKNLKSHSRNRFLVTLHTHHFTHSQQGSLVSTYLHSSATQTAVFSLSTNITCNLYGKSCSHFACLSCSVSASVWVSGILWNTLFIQMNLLSLLPWSERRSNFHLL